MEVLEDCSLVAGCAEILAAETAEARIITGTANSFIILGGNSCLKQRLLENTLIAGVQTLLSVK